MKKSKATTLLAACILGIGLAATAAEEQKPEPKKQTTCPVMEGQPINKANYIDIKGKRIYVCCKGCLNQIKANPDKYIKRLEDKGIVFEKAPAAEAKKDK